MPQTTEQDRADERPAVERPGDGVGERTDEAVTTEPEELVADELLVEEVSIDGMCGVY